MSPSLSHFDYTSIIQALELDVVIFGFAINRFGIFGMKLIVTGELAVALPRVKVCQTT